MFRQAKQTSAARRGNDAPAAVPSSATKKMNVFRLVFRLSLLVLLVIFGSLLHWIHPYDHEDVLQFKSDLKKLKQTRFVSIVMPSVVAPDKRPGRLSAIAKTWGQDARAVFVVHSLDEVTAPLQQQTLPNPKQPNKFPQVLLVPPNITVKEGVPRLIHVFQVVREHYSPEVDFTFFVNDHTFVIPEHVCRYLSDKSPSEPLYAGDSMEQNGNFVFVSGAAGYILSRNTLDQLVTRWDSDCLSPDQPQAQWIQENPGLISAKCMHEKLGVPHLDTRDNSKPTRQHRFHAFPLVRCVSGNVDQWYIDKHQGMHNLDSEAFDISYDTLAKGEDCCSEETVSFHYVEAKEAKALHWTRLKLLQNPTISDDLLKRYLSKTWPSDKKEIGYYSHLLPDEADAAFKTTMNVLRKISKKSTVTRC